MANIYLLFLAMVGLVAGQNGLPDCAFALQKQCVTKFTSGTNIGGCPQLNVSCICSQQSFLSDIACCLADVCSAADQQAAVDYAHSLCSTAGVTVPSAVTCSSKSSGASAGTASSTEPATSAAVTSTAATTTTSAAASGSATSTASQNVGNQGGLASGATGIFGGLLAALALL
ncbi:CFEM domain-containing protein [Seiridium cupressi]